MGVRARIVLYAGSEAEAREGAQAAFARMEALDRVLSDYNPRSELMALGRQAGGPPVAVGHDLFHFLRLARQWSEKTDGAFDITVGPLVQLWRRARHQGVLPSKVEIARARKLVGYRLVRLDPAGPRVRLMKRGMRLDPGAMGKGLAAQEAERVLAGRGLARSLVDLGGDLVLGAPPPGRTGWQVAQGGGRPPLVLARCAVATSGDAEQALVVGGQHYSHILDPRTGWALTNRARVTVIAPRGAVADALASALSVQGPKGLTLVRSLGGTEALIQMGDSKSPKLFATPGYPGFSSRF